MVQAPECFGSAGAVFVSSGMHAICGVGQSAYVLSALRVTLVAMTYERRKGAMADTQQYVSVRVPKEIYDAVSAVAQREERSLSAEVRRVLKRYLADQGEPIGTAA